MFYRCDLLILSGPVPKYLTSSYSNSSIPEIAIIDATPTEKWFFHDKKAMQYLQSLISIPFNESNGFQSLDIWPKKYLNLAEGNVLSRL